MRVSEEFDVCVVGGGPGGSTASTLIAMAGLRVLLLERESLPIYKIGESLLPATIHGICALLGVADEIKAANFMVKRGGTFKWGRNHDPWTFAFAESPAFEGETAFAYQVERLKFDAILLENARRKGVEVRERHRVLDVRVSDGRITGLEVRDPQGRGATISCRYVVDASGHTSPIAERVSPRIYSPFFRNVAVFGYFLDGGRLPPPRAGNIFCAAFEHGWFWYIPLSETLTSVGAVIGREHVSRLHGDHAALLGELVDACPAIRDLLANARRVTDGPYGQVRVRKDYSYRHE